MTKTIGILARIVWLAICVTALVYAYKGYEGTSDWKLEEGLAFEMVPQRRSIPGTTTNHIPGFFPRRSRIHVNGSSARVLWPRAGTHWPMSSSGYEKNQERDSHKKRGGKPPHFFSIVSVQTTG